MNFKIILTGTQITEGSRLPAWYYGRSWEDWGSDRATFHIIPINYFIKWYQFLSWKWNRFRGKLSRVDREVAKRIARTNDKQDKYLNEYGKRNTRKD